LDLATLNRDRPECSDKAEVQWFKSTRQTPALPNLALRRSRRLRFARRALRSGPRCAAVRSSRSVRRHHDIASSSGVARAFPGGAPLDELLHDLAGALSPSWSRLSWLGRSSDLAWWRKQNTVLRASRSVGMCCSRNRTCGPGSRRTAYLPGVARTLTARDGVVADGPGVAVDECEAGCRRSDESAGAHRSTSRPRQPTHRE
jgi:hypothetical protein